MTRNRFASARRRSALAVAVACATAAIIPAVASAHARVSPAVSLSGKLQLYSLAVPTEKAGLTTTKVVLTVPGGFGIDSFVPPSPGWTMTQQTKGTGDNAVVTQVTWVGGHTPTGQDSLFQFLAQPAQAETYTFGVQQTYSDGSIVNWSGPESSDAPAPAIKAVTSIGGGSSTLPIIALVIGLLGFAAAVFALVAGAGRGGGKRPLA